MRRIWLVGFVRESNRPKDDLPGGASRKLSKVPQGIFRMSQELAVIEHTYELIVWTHRHVERFPKHSRYSIGSRLEDKLLQLLECLLQAKYSKCKVASLQSAGLLVENARFLFRLCKDSRLMSIRSHEHATRRIVEISRQIQGWRKSQAVRESDVEVI